MHPITGILLTMAVLWVILHFDARAEEAKLNEACEIMHGVPTTQWTASDYVFYRQNCEAAE